MNTIESIIRNNLYQIALPLTYRNTVSLACVSKDISRNFNDMYWLAKAMYKYNVDSALYYIDQPNKYKWLKLSLKTVHSVFLNDEHNVTYTKHHTASNRKENKIIIYHTDIIDKVISKRRCKYQINLCSYFWHKKIKYDTGFDLYETNQAIGINEYKFALVFHNRQTGPHFDYFDEIYTKCSKDFVKNIFNKFGPNKIYCKTKRELPSQVQEEILQLNSHHINDIDNYVIKLVTEERYQDAERVLYGFYCHDDYSMYELLYPPIFNILNIKVSCLLYPDIINMKELLDFMLVLYDHNSYADTYTQAQECYLSEIIRLCNGYEFQAATMKHILENRYVYLCGLEEALVINPELVPFINEQIENKNYTPYESYSDEED